MKIQEFFDPSTSTLTYVLWDQKSRDAVVIDPVLDYNPTQESNSSSFSKLTQFIRKENLSLGLILETHIHADHQTSAYLLKQTFPTAKIGIHRNVVLVQKLFAPQFSLEETCPQDGSQFDVLFETGQKFNCGTLSLQALHTPGHTPVCTCYLFADSLFTGDALFMPDFGTGRCDFPMGSAKDLFHSITEVIYRLPEETKIYVGHDYQPGGRSLRFQTTVGEEKATNIHLRGDTREDDFVAMRTERDKTLAPPKLLMPSLRVNINAGRI